MKPTHITRHLLLAALLLTSTLAQAQGNSALESQKVSLQRMGEALGRTVTAAKKVTAKLPYGFFEQGCVFGVRLRPGQSVSESFALTAGQSYVFIGGGDNSARDVDVFLTDARGRVVVKDTEADAAPFVLFKPRASGRYRMSLRLKSTRGGSAFCAATVLRKGGYNLPIERITQAAAKIAIGTAAIFQGVNGGRFNQDGNTWALYGAVLKPKTGVSSDPRRYRSANRGIVAVGDDRVKDLDLALIDGNRRVVAADTKNQAVASIAYAMKQGNYSIQLFNNYSTGPALIMAVLIDLPASFRLPAQGSARNTTPRANPAFAGTWSGDWRDEGNRQEGEFQMRVARDGSFTGQLYNATVNVTAPVRGRLGADGSMTFAYSYQGTDYVARGRFRPNDDDLTGSVQFFAKGQNFGAATFLLSRDE